MFILVVLILASGALAVRPGLASGSLSVEPGRESGSLIVGPGLASRSLSVGPGQESGSLSVAPGLASGSLAVGIEDCIYATPKKRLGYYEYKTGLADIRPSQIYYAPDKDACNVRCITDDDCLATSFQQGSMCVFYNTSRFYVRMHGQIEYSLWIFCDLTIGEQPRDGRCKGLWVTYLYKWGSVRDYDSLGQMAIKDELSQLQCQKMCLDNPLCGSINLNRTHCFLVPKWPAQDMIYSETGDPTARMINWTCVSNFLETFSIAKTVKKPIPDKCTGFWKLTGRQAGLRCPGQIGILFHTQLHSQCLAECELHADCPRVYFNFTYSICVVDCVQTSDHKLEPPDMRFLEFSWVCVQDDAHKPAMNADEKSLTELGMRCVKIADNSDMFIGRDQCGACPEATQFARCDEEFEYGRGHWMIKDSCRLNQSYWAFPAQSRLLGIGQHGGRMNKSRVYTGLEHYWLAYGRADSLVSADYLECRIFNASRAAAKLDPGEVVSQAGWQHQPAIGKTKAFKKRPTKVVISASQWPFHSVRTRAAGIDLMRALQVIVFRGAGTNRQFDDVPYNFYVDDGGNVYEGRGWHNQSQDVKEFNVETIAIGFIGWYVYVLPSERSLSSVKRLIECGLDRGHIDGNYSLYIQQDLATASVSRNLVFVIRNWYRYRGFLPHQCQYMSLLIILLNVLGATVCVCLFGLFYSLCFFPAPCSRCTPLFQNRWVFDKIFPSDTDWFSNADDMFSTQDCPRLVWILSERSAASSQSRDYPQLLCLVKGWVYSAYLGTISSRWNQSTLRNTLSRFAGQDKNDLQVYEAVATASYGADSCGVVACVSSSASGLFLRNLISSWSCICLYYRISRMDAYEMRQTISNCVAINT